MNDDTTTRFTRTLAVVAAALLVLSTSGGVALAAGSTTLSATLADSEIEPGDTTTLDIVVESADGGVGAGQLGVEVSDPSVATITDVSVGSSPGSENTEIASDGSSAYTIYAFDDTADSGSVTVMTVTLTASAEGTTDVSVVAPSAVDGPELDLYLADESGSGYDLNTVESATLTVAEQNDPPTADAGDDQTVTEGDTVTLDATGSSDPDGDALSYQWSQTAGPDVTLSDATAAQPAFTAPAVDTTTTMEFSLTADDGEATDTDTVTITVDPEATVPVNSPPTADAGDDQTVDEGTTVTLDATGSSDPDGDALSYQWTQTGGPTVSLSDATAAQPTFTAPDVDSTTTMTFSLTVDDGEATDTDTVTVTVSDTDAPEPPSDLETGVELVGSDGDGEIAAGSTTTYDIVVTDASGGVGAYEIVVASGDTAVASLSDASVAGTGTMSLTETTVSVDAATLEAAILDTADTGSVVVGTVTVTGEGAGQTDLTLDVTALGNEAGQSYTVSSTTDATLTVVELPPVGGSASVPNDVDDDGVYEDVNGDGSLTVADVQLLFAQRNSAEVTQYGDFYDINGDGTFDIVDVQALWNELNESG